MARPRGRPKGTPKTGGRKKGSPDVRNQVLAKILNRIAPDDKLAVLLWRHAQKDPRTAQYLADRKWGRMPVTLAGKQNEPIVVTVEVHPKAPKV